MTTPLRLAYFITSHGFGHAARAAAVMAALQEHHPAIQFDIFTQVPRWFFHDSLVRDFRYYHVCTDVGLVQTTALDEDLLATAQRLAAFLPYKQALVTTLATLLRSAACALVLCDIAPLGIVAARAAGVPSVLVENFTWDWIYTGYVQTEPRLAQHIAYLRDIFMAADYHIQTAPVCHPCPADLTSLPVSRKPQSTPSQTRDRLGLPTSARVVLLTMGGVPEPYAFLAQLQDHRHITFVVLGSGEVLERYDNVVLLPRHPALFPPDLIYACDAVVSKTGYSIVAETYHAGVPLGYVVRQRFPEAPVLASYIATHMCGLAITEPEFHSGAWLTQLSTLLALPRRPPRPTYGAEQVARFVAGLVPLR